MSTKTSEIEPIGSMVLDTVEKQAEEKKLFKGKAGPGRPKGLSNKSTVLLKDAILKAAEAAGDSMGNDGLVSYLTWLALDHPAPFTQLLGKVLPVQIDASVSSVKISRIEIVPLSPENNLTNQIKVIDNVPD